MSKVTDKLKNMELNWNSPNVFLVILDGSGSMRCEQANMRAKLKEFVEKMQAMDESGSVIISKVVFDNSFSQSYYDTIENFSTSYNADGGTELYATIYKTIVTLIGGKDMDDSDYSEVEGAVPILQDLGYEPKFTVIVFSDGADNNGKSSLWRKKAIKAVKRVNDLGGVTAFVCFGDDVSEDVAKDLDFKNIDSQYDLGQAFDAISSSCIRQSQSSVSLTDGFFDNN